MYKNILLAVDGSEHSLRSTEEAIKLHDSSDDAHIDVVYVADYDKAKYDVLHAHDKEELEAKRRKQLLPIEKMLKDNNVTHTYHLLHGDPGPTIVAFANKGNYDLLVIGSRGLSKFQKMVLGSVSHKVVKQANCPVFVVK